MLLARLWQTTMIGATFGESAARRSAENKKAHRFPVRLLFQPWRALPLALRLSEAESHARM
jgi:hypothetical protein